MAPERSVSADLWIRYPVSASAIFKSSGNTPNLFETAYHQHTDDRMVSNSEQNSKNSFSTMNEIFSSTSQYKDTVSKWSWTVPAAQAEQLFSVIWDESKNRFVHSRDLAAKSQQTQVEQAAMGRQAARLTFARIADERSMLGMAGRTAPDHLIPEPLADDAALTSGRAAAGALRTLRPAPTTGPLRFDFLGPDPDDPAAFHFARLDLPARADGGPQRFRLACARRRAWRPAAPRCYGPGPEWGGAWGGGLSAYRNGALSNIPVRGRGLWGS